MNFNPRLSSSSTPVTHNDHRNCQKSPRQGPTDERTDSVVFANLSDQSEEHGSTPVITPPPSSVQLFRLQTRTTPDQTRPPVRGKQRIPCIDTVLITVIHLQVPTPELLSIWQLLFNVRVNVLHPCYSTPTHTLPPIVLPQYKARGFCGGSA